MGTVGAFLVGVVPSIGVGLVFWLVMRKIIRADRNERQALARFEAEDARRSLPQPGTSAESDLSE